jgi:hypothetical protein
MGSAPEKLLRNEPQYQSRTQHKSSHATGAFAPNKKWAVSPLISPPAGAVTAKLADKFVCIISIGQNGRKFNGKVLGTGATGEEVGGRVCGLPLGWPKLFKIQ